MKNRLLFGISILCFVLAIGLKVITARTDSPEHSEHTGPSFTEQYEEGTPEEIETEYAYSCLNDSGKKIYREVYGILSRRKENKPVSTSDEKLLDKVFRCVMNDHPEIFYVSGYSYTDFSLGDRFLFSGTYTMSSEEIEETREEIDRCAKKCLSGLSDSASDYQKVKYVYEYLIKNTEYDKDSAENQNICSVFLYGKSVCQGYAQATQYLLQRAGVFCTLVPGTVNQEESHAWNLVKMDGQYYYLDTTWGDASYQNASGGSDAWLNPPPQINYDYLGVTTQQLLKTHRIDDLIPYPECVCMDCNYYVREGTYFEDCSEEQLKAVFDSKFMQNNGYITIKCANANVYKKARSLLIDRQLIFELIGSKNGSVAYSENPVQCSLSFWI